MAWIIICVNEIFERIFTIVTFTYVCDLRMTLDERLSAFLDKKPTIHDTAFVTASATVVGDVHLGEESSIWFNAVLRGDINRIQIGPRSNIQDGAVVHVADEYSAVIGAYVTCGHNAILHACAVDDEVLIGMGATILDGAVIGARSVVGANALVTMGMKIPPGSLVLGSPGRVVRQLGEAEQQAVKTWAEKYVELSRRYLQRERREM